MVVKEPDVVTACVSQASGVSFEDFLTQHSEDIMAEWVDGEVIVMSPAAMRHQELVGFLVKILGLYIDVHKLGVLLPAPFVMRMAELNRGRQSDLLFVTNQQAHLIEKTHLNGAADLVIEIVSPESFSRDRGEKFVEYERAGVKEYWLIDPDRESIEFYQLGVDSRYHAALLNTENIYTSKIVQGFRMRVAWLWQSPPPTLDALRELGII